MSNGAHVATKQEKAIYQALSAGDQQVIADMRADAYGADQTRPADAPEDWLSPAEQYDLDYGYAWSHYQKDHEPPDAARERATKAAVADENDTAAEMSKRDDTVTT